jgi:hypothetical protein
MSFRQSRVPPSKCLNCGKEMDAATSTEGDYAPQPGSIGICFHCRHLMAYADDLTLRELTGEEVVEIAGNPVLLRAMKIIGGFHKWREKRDAAKKKAP